MYKTISIVSMMFFIASFSFSATAANECRLKYKNNGSAFQYKNVNKGQTINFTRSNLNEMYNVGRNDMLITLQYTDLGGNTRTETQRLIKSGSVTLPFPPLVIFNKTLKKIRCFSYSTITDTQQYINQFGNNAGNLVNQSRTQAQNAINSLALSTANAFTASQANTNNSSSQQAIQQVQTAFNQAKSAMSNLRVNLQQDFPEVNSAVQSTTSYTWQLPASVLNQGNQNISNTKTKLQSIDQKYAVSQTANELISVDLASDFPEINALVNQRCDFNARPLDLLGGEINRLRNLLTQLDRKYKFSSTADKAKKLTIKLTRQEVEAVLQLRNLKPCNGELSETLQAMAADWSRIRKYLNSILAEINKLKPGQFTGKQAEFYKQLTSFANSIKALIAEIDRQNRREKEMEEADKAHQKAYEKIRNDIGPMHDVLEKYPGGDIVIMGGVAIKNELPFLFGRDNERLKKNLEAEKRAADNYIKAIETYDRGEQELNRKWNTLFNEIGKTAKLATQLRIKLPAVDKLLALLTKPPKLAAIHSSWKGIKSCLVNNINVVKMGAIAALKALDQYGKGMLELAKTTLPEDIREALIAYKRAFDDFYGLTLQSSDMGSELGRSIRRTATYSANLLSILEGDITQANFSSQARNSLNQLRQQIANETALNANNLYDYYQSSTSAFNKSQTAGTQLGLAIRRNTISSIADVAELVDLHGKMTATYDTVISVVGDTQNCISGLANAGATAVTRMPQRLGALIASKVNTVANALPANVKQSISGARSTANSLQQSFAQFQSAANDASNKLGQFSTSVNTAVASFTPTPGPTTTSKLHTAVDKFDEFDQSMQTLNTRWQTVLQRQNQLLSQINNIRNAMNAAGGEAATDAAQLAFVAFNANLVSQQLSAVPNLLNKWNLARQTLPERLASFASGGLSDSAISQIQAGLNQMNQKHQQLQSCIANATSARSFINNSNRKTQAVNQTLNGMQNQANNVISSLAALLPPNPGSINQVNNVLSQAATLAQRITQVQQTARSNFQTLINLGVDDLNTAKNCVVNNKNFNLNKRNQLMSQINGR